MSKQSNTSYKPIILIGAARSGTKILRDMIAIHGDVDRVPYDVNYIWRKGQEKWPDDALPIDRLTPAIKEFIHVQMGKFNEGAPFLVEKTVSNCVRVGYCREVYPQGKFVLLTRDGRDVVESVYRQWLAKPDLKYIVEKMKSFPLMDAMGYAAGYAGKTFNKLVLGKKDAGIWGVLYPGIQDDLRTKSLLEVCAIQWVKSVEAAAEGIAALPQQDVLNVRYEEFVQDPAAHIGRICQFVGVSEPDAAMKQQLQGSVKKDAIGKGFRNLDAQQVDLVMPILEPTLKKMGYLP